MACHRYEHVTLITSSEVCDGYAEEISPSDVAEQRIEEDRAKRMQERMMHERMKYQGTWVEQHLAFEERKLAFEERRLEADFAIAKSDVRNSSSRRRSHPCPT